MRRPRKIFNSFFSGTLLALVLALMLTSAQYCFAGTSDSSVNLNVGPVLTDSMKHAYNYARQDFCKCSEDKIATVMPLREVATPDLERHRGEKEFQYERSVKDEASSFWNNFWNWLQRKLFGKINKKNAEFVKSLFYWVIAVFAVIIVGFWLYKTEFLGRPMRRSTKINNVLYDETERSREDIDAMINGALENNDYPLAIRWVYIKCIKTLSSRNQIEIRQDKTNYDYYLELKNRDLQPYFFQLTRLFEYTNYGDFTSKPEHYSEAEEIFTKINNNI